MQRDLFKGTDKDDFSQPIVSVSLRLPAKFLFGGLERSNKPLRTQLAHGDVVVWGMRLVLPITA